MNLYFWCAMLNVVALAFGLLSVESGGVTQAMIVVAVNAALFGRNLTISWAKDEMRRHGE